MFSHPSFPALAVLIGAIPSMWLLQTKKFGVITTFRIKTAAQKQNKNYYYYYFIVIIFLSTGLGSKKQPVHCLVSHGSLLIKNPPPVDFQQLQAWFQESPEGRVEGIVWHCSDGTLVKVALKICYLASMKCFLKAFRAPVRVCLQVHRHHLGLRWPDGGTCLGDRPLVVRVDPTVDEYNSSNSSKDLFTPFSRLNGRRFSRLQEIQLDS